MLDGYVRGALKLGELTLAELREAALHLAVYAGWSRGVALDTAVTRVAEAAGAAARRISRPFENSLGIRSSVSPKGAQTSRPS